MREKKNERRHKLGARFLRPAHNLCPTLNPQLSLNKRAFGPLILSKTRRLVLCPAPEGSISATATASQQQPTLLDHSSSASLIGRRPARSAVSPFAAAALPPGPGSRQTDDDGAASSVGGRASSSPRRRGGAVVLLLPRRVRGGCAGGGVVRRQLRDHGRRGPRQDVRRRADLVPLPRQQDRRRVPDEAAVPLRLVQHEAEARGQRLRGRRHRLLHVLGRGRGAAARRAGLRVPGQPQRGALHHPDQRVPQRRGRAGDAPLALVRPHRRLPHLRHPLEHQAHRVLRGQGGDPGVPERPIEAWRRERLLPELEAHVHLLEHLERGRLGDARRAGEDGLGQGALRVLLPRLRRRRLPLAGGRPFAAGVRRGHGGQLVGPAAGVGAGRRAAPGQRVGGAQPPHLRLLRRPDEVPDAAPGVRAPGRRHRLVIDREFVTASSSSPVGTREWGFEHTILLVDLLVMR